MTGKLQAFLDTSEDFRKKSGKLAQSIEIKLCRQAAEAKEAGNAMEVAILSLQKELALAQDRQYYQQKEMYRSIGQEKGDG